MKSVLKLTPSRVRDYTVCPRRFEQQYVRGGMGAGPVARTAESAALSFGSSLHAVLDDVHRPASRNATSQSQHSPTERDVMQPSDIPDAMIEQMLCRHWQGEGYTDSLSEEAAFTSACSILKFYLRSGHVPIGEVLATEAYLTCVTTIKGYPVELSCRADRIELHSDGTLEVLDYKTSTSGEVPSTRALADDLCSFLYFLLCWHHYRDDHRIRNVRLSQLNLISLARVEVQYDQHQIVQHKKNLEELVLTAMSGPLEPKINPGCAWCVVQDGCPAWVALDMADLDKFEAWQQRSA
jgi:RecB family exonuclease